MLLKAPYIITMAARSARGTWCASGADPAGDVIENGAVRTDGDHIAEVGVGVKATRADATITLDRCILLPGLVNAHSHLDLSYLAGRLPPPTSFAAWVEQIIAARQHATDTQVADGLRAALQQCYRSGITCVGDHVGHWGILPLLLQMPLRGRAFLEITGPTEQRARAMLATAQGLIERYHREARRMTLSVTPHAPYSVHPAVLRELLSTYAHTHIRTDAQGIPLSIHCAETAEEWTCFTECRGALYDLVAQRGLPLTTPSRSPVDYLERNGGIARHTMMVHANMVDDTDLAGLHAAGTTVVHCPQSHRYFRNAPFPLERMRAAGIPVALGTDNLATAPCLNLLVEMQLLKEAHPALLARDILAMATTHGAGALGMHDLCGRIAPGLRADLIAVPCGDMAHDPYEQVLRQREIPFVIIDGRIVRNVLKGEHRA